jgi:hypothetical protein
VGVLVLLKAMKIELLYVKGCLRWKSALARLRQVLREQRVRESVEIIEVNDQEEAVRWRFLGSPTIRINDYDIEPEAASRTDFGLGCRTYPEREMLYGVPSKEMIRGALRARRLKWLKVCHMGQEHSEPKVDGTTDRYDDESGKSPATHIAPPSGKRLFGNVRMDSRQVRW